MKINLWLELAAEITKKKKIAKFDTVILLQP